MEDFEVFDLGCPNCYELESDKLVRCETSDKVTCQSCGVVYQFGSDEKDC
jgi:uncharacterized Zn finger protein